jgi:hypothetical protein
MALEVTFRSEHNFLRRLALEAGGSGGVVPTCPLRLHAKWLNLPPRTLQALQ